MAPRPYTLYFLIWILMRHAPVTQQHPNVAPSSLPEGTIAESWDSSGGRDLCETDPDLVSLFQHLRAPDHRGASPAAESTPPAGQLADLEVNHGAEPSFPIGYDLGMLKKHPGLVTLYSNPADNTFLLMDITKVLGRGNRTQFTQLMVTAMVARGTYIDGVGQQATLHEPLEGTDDTILGFRLASDLNSVDVLRPQNRMRTSDKQMNDALQMGVGSSWVGSLGRVPVRGTGADGLVVIDAGALIFEGFYVTSTLLPTHFRVLRTKSYAQNFDITVEYLQAESPRTVSFSAIAVPMVPMEARLNDDRLAFFTSDYVDLGIHAKGPREIKQSAAFDKPVSMIWRYNLTAQPGHQIRIHVDPTVPKRWRRYFREGIEAWNAAFEPLGFPAAMRGVLPDDDDWPAEYDAGDARYSSISWSLDSDVYAMGVAKADPRSGEILKSDVIFTDGWVRSYMEDLESIAPRAQMLLGGLRHEKQGFDHRAGGPDLSTRQLLRRSLSGEGDTDQKDAGKQTSADGLVGRTRTLWRQQSQQLGVLQLLGSRLSDVQLLEEAERVASAAGTWRDADLTAAQFDAIGSGLRSIVMHEVGHILGLRHNFKGSLGVSYECTQNINCSMVHGLSASVMDYMPMNMPGAGAGQVLLFPAVIGPFDKLAIRYGYMASSEEPELEAVLQEAQENFDVCMDSDYSMAEDPLCETHDVSSDPLLFYEDQLSLVAESERGLLLESVGPGMPYKRYGDAVVKLLNKLTYLAGKLVLWIGGVNTSHVHRRYDGLLTRPAERPIPIAMQRRALRSIVRILRPSSSGYLPATGERRFLVSGRGDLVHAVDLRDMVLELQEIVMGLLFGESQFLHMEEGFGRLDNSSRGFTGHEFLSAIIGDILFNPGNVSVVADAQNWDLQIFLVRGLNKLLCGSKRLPENLAALVTYHRREAHNFVERFLKDINNLDGKELLRAHLERLQEEFKGAPHQMFCLRGGEAQGPAQAGSPAAPAPVLLAAIPALVGMTA